jgi:hypothetical protein
MSELSVGQLKGLLANDNVITVPSGHTLYAPGSVVQVVSFSNAAQFSTTSTSFVNTTLTTSITPKFSTSKIFISIDSTIETAGTSTQTYYTIFRGTSSGVNLGNSTNGFGMVRNVAGTIDTAISASFLDSPSTTLSVQYMLGLRTNTGTTYLNPFLGMATITLLEIAQ